MKGQNEQYKLSDKEITRIRELALKAEATYQVIGETLSERSGVIGDAERFMAVTYMSTVDLLKHSETLGNQTKWLIRLTLILVVLTGVLIYQTF